MDIVLLGDSDTAKHGRRYSQQEKDAAYILWRIVCGRSARKVSERTGIEARTIHRWIEQDGWNARAAEEDTDDYSSMRIAAVALATNKVAPAIEKIAWLMDNAKDEKVQADAAKWLAGIGGVSPVSKIEQAVIQAPTTTEVIDVPSLVGKSPEELMRLEESIRQKGKR